MKRTTLFLLFIFGLSFIGKCTRCDTIDVYWVYYNDTVWAKLNQYSGETILHLSKSEIKKRDTIAVNYTTDTPNPDARHSITLKDENGNKLDEVYNIGSWAPLSFSVSKILAISATHGKYIAFYYDGDRLLFKLYIE